MRQIRIAAEIASDGTLVYAFNVNIADVVVDGVSRNSLSPNRLKKDDWIRTDAKSAAACDTIYIFWF